MNLFIRNYRWSILSLLFFVVASFIIYYPTFEMYFLNDEWVSLGHVSASGVLIDFFISNSIPELLIGKGRVLGSLVYNILLFYFKEQVAPIVIFSLMCHGISSWIMMKLTYLLTMRNMVAFLAAILFLSNSVSYQGLTWLAASIQTPGALVLALAGLYILLTSLRQKRNILFFVGWSLIYLSILFKDGTAFFALIGIGVTLFYRNNMPFITHLKSKKYYLIIFLFSIVCYRVIDFFKIGSVEYNVTFVDGIQKILRAGFNTFWYPLVSLSHFIIPQRLMLRISEMFGLFVYPFLTTYPKEAKELTHLFLLSDIVSLLISIVILVLSCYYFFYKTKERKLLYFIAFSYIVSFIPVAIFLHVRNTGYLESRYYYFVQPFVSIFFALLIYHFYRISNNIRKFSFFINIVITVIICAFIYKQIRVIQGEIGEQVLYAQEVKRVHQQFLSLLPTPPNNPIFLVTGDDFPIQLGLGYLLMVWYYPSGVIPDSLVSITDNKPRYLPTSMFTSKYHQGIRYDKEKSFGYFYNIDDLISEIENNKPIDKKRLISFHYDAETKIVTNTTTEVVNNISTISGIFR